MKELHSFLLIMTISIAVFGQSQQKMSVYFDTDKHDLKEKDRLELDRFTEKIPSLTDYSIEILAHTDSRGSLSYNQALANRRAKAVEIYLTKKGVIISKVEARSFGESQPKFLNNNAFGRQQNRRVDIIVQPIKKAFEEAPILTQLKAEKHQVFTLKANKKNVIKANEGTIITIPPNAFEYKNGSNEPVRDVTIDLKEAYTFGDMILLNLSTTSDGKMLETGGMIHIEASSNGQELKIKDGKSYNIKMPTTAAQSDMQLFIGEQNSVDNSVNWKATNEPFEVKNVSETATENALRPKRQRALPVVLNENGEINRKATDKLHRSGKDLEINEDYVPFYEDARIKLDYAKNRNGKPLIMGYIPKSINQAWENSWKTKPKEVRKKILSPPKEPIKPKREDVNLPLTRRGQLRLGEKGVEARIDILFQRKMRFYQDKVKRYHHEMGLYVVYMRSLNDTKDSTNSWATKKDAILDLIDNNIIWDEQYGKRQLVFKTKEERINDLENKFKEKGELEGYELQYYVRDINQMGYINCDKFPSFSLFGRRPIMVKQEASYKSQTMVVVHRFKSVLNLNSIGTIHKSAPVPNNVDITILSFYTKDGQLFLGKKITKSGKEDVFELEYQPVSLFELKKELEI